MENPYAKYVKNPSNPYAKYVDTPMPPPSREPSFLSGVSEAMSKRGSNIGDIWGGEQQGVLPPSGSIGPKVFRTAGQMAGGVQDIATEGIKSAYRNIVPQGAQEAISGFGSDILQSAPVQGAMPYLQSMQEGYGNIKKDYPEQVGMLEATGNIAGILPMGWLAGKGAGVVKGAVTPLETAASIEQKIDKVIYAGMQKGIKPSVKGKSDAGLVKQFYDNSKVAVRDIVDASPTPISKAEHSIEAFSNAVAETKKNIHKQYSQMAQQAGEQGAVVDLKPVIIDMTTVAKNHNVRRANPGLADMLEKRIAEWSAKPTLIDPVEAEDLIAMLNQQAKGYWADPTNHTTAAGVERIAQKTRQQTFNAINQYQGPGYSDLRKRYGAQLALEKEVTDRATRVGNRAKYGFFDLSNVATAAEFVSALSGSPVSLARAGGIWGTKKLMQMANDPERIIKKMFEKVEILTEIKKKYQRPDMGSFARQTPRTYDAAQEALDIPRRDPTLQLSAPTKEMVPYRPPELDMLRGDPTLGLPPGGQMDRYIPPSLDFPRRDPTLALPSGQGFEIPRPPPPALQNVRGEGFTARPSGVYEGFSNGQITREELRKLIKKSKSKKRRYIQTGP